MRRTMTCRGDLLHGRAGIAYHDFPNLEASACDSTGWT